MDMNLAEMLSYSDIEQLSSIARHYDCQCSSNSKKELIQAILCQMNKQEVARQLIENSRIEELRFLNSLLFEQRSFFSMEELFARAKLTRFTKTEDMFNPRDLITRFKQRGWLFHGYSQDTKYLFQMPQDLKKRYSAILAQHFQSSLQFIPAPVIFHDEQQFIEADIRLFLHYVLRHDLPITMDGYLYKRHIQQLLDQFAVQEKMVQKSAWRFGYGRRCGEYPNRFSLIYDYCYKYGYIEEFNQRLLITEKGKQCLLNEQQEDISDIYHFWLACYRRPIKNLLSFVYWIKQLAQSWVTVDSLKLILCDYIQPFYYDHAETILEHRILRMMVHLGLLRLSEDEKGGKAVQLTRQGDRLIP